jgi:hypothetical protein
LDEGAYGAFKGGNIQDGFEKLEEVNRLLKKIPSR